MANQNLTVRLTAFQTGRNVYIVVATCFESGGVVVFEVTGDAVARLHLNVRAVELRTSYAVPNSKVPPRARALCRHLFYEQGIERTL